MWQQEDWTFLLYKFVFAFVHFSLDLRDMNIGKFPNVALVGMSASNTVSCWFNIDQVIISLPNIYRAFRKSLCTFTFVIMQHIIANCCRSATVYLPLSPNTCSSPYAFFNRLNYIRGSNKKGELRILNRKF